MTETTPSDAGTEQNKTLVWIDLEMTGLDVDNCVIVQLAMIITDRELKPVAKPLDIVIWQPDSVLESMEPFVRKMHESSGLLEKIRKSSVSAADAEKKTMKILTSNCGYRTAPLCGNSVGQDRLFLARYMPQLEGFLHYRNLDVSSVKLLGNWWYKCKYKKPETGKHTAMHDIEQSIAELKHYRAEIFA